MSAKQYPTQQFVIGKSVLLIRLINTLHILTLIACWLNSLSTGLQIFLSTFVLSSWHYQLNKQKNTNLNLVYTENEGWGIAHTHTTKTPIKILATTTISAFFIFMHLTIEQRRQNLIIPRDSLTQQDFRQLRHYLKTKQWHV